MLILCVCIGWQWTQWANASSGAGGFGGPHSGLELDAIGGYILVMVEAYETFHNATYLQEAKIAAERFATDRGEDEFYMSYELPMEAMGMLGLAKLNAIEGAKATQQDGDNGNSTDYLELSIRPLAYTLVQCSLFQADYGFRDGLPTYMALAAMSGTYVAGMEGHTSAWYVSEWLRVVSESSSHKSAGVQAAVALATQYVQHAGGVMRSLYPSGMPAAALSEWAYQTGAPNNASVEIPVEDYRFDRSQPGIVGQEVYGSGAAFDMAILQRRHGAKASVRSDTTTTTTTTTTSGSGNAVWAPGQYLWPRAISARRGQAVTISVYYPHAKLVAELEAPAPVLQPLIEAATKVSPFALRRVDQREDGTIHPFPSTHSILYDY